MSEGLEGRYRVEKIDDPNGKHTQCRYFVLDPLHDETARMALAEYARVTPDRVLARDLWDWLETV